MVLNDEMTLENEEEVDSDADEQTNEDETTQFDDAIGKRKNGQFLDGKLSLFIVIAILLFVNLAAIVLFMTDAGHIRSNLIIMTNSKLSQTASDLNVQKQQLEKDLKAFHDAKSSLASEKKTLSDKEAELKEKQDELTKQQQELQDKQNTSNTQNVAGDSSTPANTSSDKDIAKLVKIYENMDAKAAAKVIVTLGIDDEVLIMKNMKQDAAAEIFNAMDPAQSSIIMNNMINGN